MFGVSRGKTVRPADGRGHFGWTDDDLRSGIVPECYKVTLRLDKVKVDLL